MNLYSRIEPTQLLHIIVRKSDIQHGRVDLVPSDEFLQCAAIRQPQGTTYKAHRHVVKGLPHEGLTQESWCIISGLVRVMLYDLDDTLLHSDVLEPGDISITLQGGHNYEFIAEDSIVYEYKTGPYIAGMDKTFI